MSQNSPPKYSNALLSNQQQIFEQFKFIYKLFTNYSRRLLKKFEEQLFDFYLKNQNLSITSIKNFVFFYIKDNNFPTQKNFNLLEMRFH